MWIQCFHIPQRNRLFKAILGDSPQIRKGNEARSLGEMYGQGSKVTFKVPAVLGQMTQHPVVVGVSLRPPGPPGSLLSEAPLSVA